jgi:hypothetical protein
MSLFKNTFVKIESSLLVLRIRKHINTFSGENTEYFQC